MLKKLSLLAGLICLCLSLTACTSPDVAEYYQTAQLYLGCGDYDYAAELFAQLGEYEDAADYTLYARALQAMDEENYDLARTNLEAVNPFKSSGRYLMYLDALAAEEEGEMETALSLYEKLGTFCDSHQAAERLKTAIPEAAIKEGRTLMSQGEYEKARALFLSLDGYGASEALANNCTAALNKAAYAAAEKLADSGDLLGAMAAFTAMGDALDAARQAADCRAAIHAELDKQYTAVTLATAPDLIAAYQELGEDETARKRIDELTVRFGKNLQLITMDAPVVVLGKYPGAESGEEQPITWCVIKTEDSKLTLLSTQVLDASVEATIIPLVLTDAERSAVSETMLPSMAELVSQTELTCTATPYALAQGAANENGCAAYWLRDSLENGQHPIISTIGIMSLPTAEMTPGVRPIMTLDLEKIAFTAGSGTAEDPFIIE